MKEKKTIWKPAVYVRNAKIMGKFIDVIYVFQNCGHMDQNEKHLKITWIIYKLSKELQRVDDVHLRGSC